MRSSSARYLVIAGASSLIVLLLAWAYVAAAPMAFMESGYAAWAAKSTMLRQCRLGQVAFFGDSRLEAGLIPAALPVPVTNFGFSAGTAVEANTAIRRALACPTLPRQAVITLVPEHFGPLSKFFWMLSLRYGFLSPADLWRTEALAHRLGDHQSLATPTPDGLHGRLRDALYVFRFPSLSFASLVQGRVFGRYATNEARYHAVLRSRGWSEYHHAPDVPADADSFVITKLQDAELEGAIADLRRRGVDVLLLVMPFARSHPETDAILAAYLAHLTEIAHRFPGVTLLDDTVPIWPDRFFADGAHLDGQGAHLFSTRLATCFHDGTLQAGCDLAWHPQAQADSDPAAKPARPDSHWRP